MGENKPKLAAIDGETLMDTRLEPTKFCIETLLPQGITILGGAPKIGKSWWVLELCVRIAKGESVWGMPTAKGTTLYLCLEDTLRRVQERLGYITDDVPSNAFFATAAHTLAEGLCDEIRGFVKEHPDTVFVAIDTFASYKDKRKLYRPESEWLRFENTHEAIIDQDTWELVRKVRAGKRRRTSMGDVNKYSGILCCADCGSKLYFVRGTTMKPESYGFICSRYRKHMGEEQCTPHSIREKVLDEIILEEIRKVTYYARSKTQEFVEYINKKSSSENKRELIAKTNDLSRLERRNTELNALFKRLYEDNVLGKVTNEQFRMLSVGYNEEQHDIHEQIPKLQAEIEELKASATNVDKFVAIANKFTDLQELTPEVLCTFIAKVVIHERTEKRSKTAEQQIDIYFRYIGSLTVQPVKQAG